MNDKKIGLLDVIMIFLLTSYACVVFCPVFHGRFAFSVYSLAIEPLWCICALIQAPRLFQESLKNHKLCVLTVFLTVAIPYLFGSNQVGNRYSTFVFFAFGVIVWDYCLRANKISHIKTTLYLLTPVLVATYFTTFNELVANPYASRLIKSNATEEIGFVGGYSYVYPMVLIFCILLGTYKFINAKNRKYVLVPLILIFALAVKSNYFTALILCIVALFITTCLDSKKDGALSIKISRVFVFVTVVVMFELVLSSFVTKSFVDQILQDGKTKNRILTMIGDDASRTSIYGMSEGLSSEIEEDRLPTILKSVNTCFNNPITGAFYRKDALDISSGIIGHHSMILDTFALFGFFVGLLFLIFLCEPFRKHDKELDLTQYRLTVFVPFILLLLVDNATPSVAFVSTIIYPFVRRKISESINFNKGFRK